MKRKTQRLLAKLTLALVVTLVCLVFIEICLQLTYGRRKPAYAVSPGGGKTYEIINEEFVHQVRTNTMNLRDEEFGPPQDHEHRVLFTGDSFTFALGVDIEDAFHVRMEQQLQHGGKRFNALNFGGRREFVFQASSTLREMEADALVAQVFIGNDFYDLQTDMDREFEPIGAPAPAAGRPIPVAAPAATPAGHSPSGAVSETAAAATAAPKPAIPTKPKKPFKLYTLEILWRTLIKIEAFDNLLFKMDLRYGERPILLHEYPELEKRLVARELEVLTHLHEAAKAHGVDFYIFIIPSKVQCLKADLLDKDKYDYQKPNRILKDFCVQRGIPCLDFLELYDQMPPRTVRTFYYHKDMHWTQAGHHHAADALARFLAKADPSFQLKHNPTPDSQRP